MLLKTLFLLPHLFCNVEFEFSWFHNTEQSSEILILKKVMLLQFQNKTNYWVLINAFWICLNFVRYRFGNHRFDTHLDFLDAATCSKPSASLQGILNRSSRHIFKTSSRHVFKKSWRRLQRNNFSSSNHCFLTSF